MGWIKNLAQGVSKFAKSKFAELFGIKPQEELGPGDDKTIGGQNNGETLYPVIKPGSFDAKYVVENTREKALEALINETGKNNMDVNLAKTKYGTVLSEYDIVCCLSICNYLNAWGDKPFKSIEDIKEVCGNEFGLSNLIDKSLEMEIEYYVDNGYTKKYAERQAKENSYNHIHILSAFKELSREKEEIDLFKSHNSRESDLNYLANAAIELYESGDTYSHEDVIDRAKNNSSGLLCTEAFDMTDVGAAIRLSWDVGRGIIKKDDLRMIKGGPASVINKMRVLAERKAIETGKRPEECLGNPAEYIKDMPKVSEYDVRNNNY